MTIKHKKIPNGWEVMKLINYSKIFDGTHQTPHYVNEGIPFYSVEHVTSNDFKKTKFISENVYFTETKRIERGDILMSRIGDIGTAKFVDWNVQASFYVTLALIKCEDTVNAKFITYLINSQNFQREIWGKTIHVAFPNKINLGDIGKCESLLPPLHEQNRIVSVLETWDSYLKKLEKKIETKRKIKKGLMQQLLTGKKRLPGFSKKWGKIALGKICKIQTGKKDVNQGNHNGIYPFFTCAKQHTYSDTYSFDCDAILIAGNGDVGNCQFYSGKFEVYQRTYLLNDFKIFIHYIFPYLKHFFQNTISIQKQMGAMPYIKLETIQNFNINIPHSNLEQNAIAKILITADEEIEVLEKQKEKYEDQKKYLLNNLITGKIRVPKND